MNFRILGIARQDLQSAARYYEEESTGLGFDFLDEFESTMARVLQSPNAWQMISARHRRCLLRRFPYGVIYALHEAEIIVVGVMDLRRAPTRISERFHLP